MHECMDVYMDGWMHACMDVDECMDAYALLTIQFAYASCSLFISSWMYSCYLVDGAGTCCHACYDSMMCVLSIECNGSFVVIVDDAFGRQSKT